jgi:HK97 family phage portal protein/2'-5' RNA ligase
VLNMIRSGLTRFLPTRTVQTRMDPNTPFALYFEPSGKVRPLTIKNMGGWSGNEYNAINQSMARGGNATPSEIGYAYLSEVNVWVRRCIEIRASNIKRLDWYVEDKVSGKRLDDHPLTIAMKRARHFFQRTERSLLIWGELYVKPLKNDYGHYSDVWWLNNLSVNFDIVNGFIQRFYYAPLHGGKPYVWNADEMCYIYTENAFDDLRGSSKVLSILHEANVHEEIARAAQAHFANDARPGIMFLPEVDLGVPQAQEFMDYWKANFQGSANANKPVMLPQVMKSVQVIERAALKDDVEFRASIRREICAAFGVPLSVAGAWDDANYQSAPEQRISLYEETIIPEGEQIAEDLTRDLLPFFGDPVRQRVWFDGKNLLALAEDKQAKAQALTAQLNGGGMTLNEYRAALDQAEISEGNVFYIPAGITVTPVDKLGSMPAPQPPGGGGFGFNSAPASTVSVEPPEVPALPAETEKAAGSMAMVLTLPNHADLIGLQNRLKQLLPDPSIKWTDPATFHITLVYAPAVTEPQIDELVSYMSNYTTPELNLNVGSLASFDKVGEHALHFRIPRDGTLTGFQEELYTACQSMGLPLSSYSEPHQFKPHITMGYAPQRMPITRFQSNLHVKPGGMEVSINRDGKYDVVHRCEVASTAPTIPAPEKPKGLPGSTEAIEVIEPPPPAKFGSPFDGINQHGDEPHLPESIVSIPVDPFIAELNQYEKFTLNRWGQPKRSFQFKTITEPLLTELTAQVKACTSKGQVERLFEGLRGALKAPAEDDDPDIVTPEQAQEWWGDYDRLMKTLGNDWLRDYMKEVWRRLESRLTREIEVGDVETLLTDFHPDLIQKWTGTADDPGVIAKLYMAGMGAGQQALERKRTNMNPNKATELVIDWSLVPADAIAAVEKYVGKLIRGIDKTTLTDVQKLITEWLESGGTIADLTRQLSPIFNDPGRAEMIAQTESSNAYNRGALQRWEDAGVTKMRFVTVRDSRVCPQCEALAGKVGTLENGWDGQTIPIHPRCRCYARPVL